jgi:hypothetical protein
MTVKADAGAVVAFSDSLYVNVRMVPAVLIARGVPVVLMVGAVRSTVDELVVMVRDVSETASLPTRS